MREFGSKMPFFEKHRKQLYCISLLAFFLMVAALIPGIGYEAIANANPAGVIGATGASEGSVSIGRLCRGTLNVSFNPFFYPVSYFSGRSSVFRKYVGAAELWDHEGVQVAEAATIGTVFSELLRNIPYFLAASALLTLALGKVSSLRRVLGKATLINAQRQP